MSKIKKIFSRQIIDSRGNPTVEADIITDSGLIGRAAVPSGASTGKHEAVELRDNDMSIYNGKGVLNAVSNINNIINNELTGLALYDQNLIDSRLITLDGTENKSNLGANAMLAVSLAYAKASALSKKQSLYNFLSQKETYELPIPMMNILNGGSHADNSIDFQEFMVMPVGASSFSHALQMGTEIFHCLKSELKNNGYSTNVGDEGGFAPNLSSNEEAIEIILESILKVGLNVGKDIQLALDVAASELFDNGVYTLASENKKLNTEEMVKYLKTLVKKYPIVSIEDGLDENDWDGWKQLTSEIGDSVQIVGDDLTVTNINRLKRSIDEKSMNAILIKLNQIGTVTETIQAIEMSRNAGFGAVISHRSGETEDTTIADLSVAMGMGQIKTGSASRTDRVCKYNQLLRIEEELGSKAKFANQSILGHMK